MYSDLRSSTGTLKFFFYDVVASNTTLRTVNYISMVLKIYIKVKNITHYS